MLIDIGELFFRTIALYKKHFSSIFVFIILFCILGLAPRWINPHLPVGNGSVLLFGLETCVLIVLGTWLPAAFIASLGHTYTDNVPTSAIQSLRITWPKLLSVFGTSFISSLIIGWPIAITSFLLLVGLALGKSSAAGFAHTLTVVSVIALIPAIVYTIRQSIRLTFSMYAVILDHKTVRGSLSWSRLVVRGRWWAMFGRIIGIAFILSLVASIPSSILAAIGGAVNAGTVTKVFNYCIVLIQVFVAPLFIIAHLILYTEAKKTIPSPPTPPAAPSSTTPSPSV